MMVYAQVNYRKIKLRRAAQVVCMFACILSFGIFLVTPIAFLDGFDWLYVYMMIVTFAAGLLFLFPTVVLAKGYKFRFVFSKKKFNGKLKSSLEKFGNAPDEFKDKFKKTARKNFYETGELFQIVYTDWVFKSKNSKAVIAKLYEQLLSAVKSGGGFVEFIQIFNSEELSDFFSQFIEGDYPMSGYTLNNYLSSMASGELRFLFCEVLLLCDFSVYDNGLSEDFTKKNKDIIELLNNIYSPILFSFEHEIEEICKKLCE